MWRFSFIFFALSAIINGDPADLTSVLHNNNELNINDNTEKDLINDEVFTKKDIISLQDPSNLSKFNMNNFYHVEAIGLVFLESRKKVN